MESWKNVVFDFGKASLHTGVGLRPPPTQGVGRFHGPLRFVGILMEADLAKVKHHMLPGFTKDPGTKGPGKVHISIR